MVTISQPHQALAHANRARAAIRDIRLELAAGAIGLTDALTDERSASATIYDLLRAVPGIGPITAARTCNRLMIPQRKRCRELTDRQKRILACEAPRASH